VTSKKDLTERDICTKYITPALEKAGWDTITQILEEYLLTRGRVIVRGKLHTRAKNKRADYVLFYKPNIPIAIIEAKDNNHTIGDGMQQALGYAELLHVPFVFSSNGDSFLFHNSIAADGIVEREINLHQFPAPETLRRMWCEYKGITHEQEHIIAQDYYSDSGTKIPRYYQLAAINKTIEAIANGNNRILLVMATGTGFLWFHYIVRFIYLCFVAASVVLYFKCYVTESLPGIQTGKIFAAIWLLWIVVKMAILFFGLEDFPWLLFVDLFRLLCYGLISIYVTVQFMGPLHLQQKHSRLSYGSDYGIDKE